MTNDNGKEYKLNKILRDTGCDRELAEMLLDFTKGDENGVMRIIMALPRNIVVFKGKFIAQKRKIYGLFLIYYDKNKTEVARVIGAISTEKDVSRPEIRDSYQNIDHFIQDYLKTHESSLWDRMESEGLLARIREILNAEYWPKMIQEASKDELEREVIKALDRSLMRFLNDNQIAIKLDIEEINEFQYAKALQSENENEESNDKEEELLEDEKKEESTENRNIIILQCEPELSPVTGIESVNLKPGDEIFVRINDNRDIAHYLQTLLNGQNPENQERKLPIIGKVVSVHDTETENVRIMLQFGPGIMGQVLSQREVKIKMKNQLPGQNLKKGKDNKKESSNLYFWGFLIVSLALVFIISMLIYLNN